MSLKINLLFCFLIFVYSNLEAQDIHKLSGTVKNSKGEMVAAGDVFLLSATDSALVKVSLVKDGSYVFTDLKSGSYLIKISCSGYSDEVASVSLSTDMAKDFQLTESNKSLQGVTVTGARKLISTKGGNIKIGVENSMFANSTSAADLLGKLPSVQLAPGGEAITVVGKGAPILYMEGRQVTFEEYSSIPVADIKSIEIINNPSAKYEANGRAIILITRKNAAKGGKVDITETAIYRKYFSNRVGINSSFKKKRIEFKASFQYNKLTNWESNAYSFDMQDQQILSKYSLTSVTKRNQFIVGLGAYYQLGEGDYLSINTIGRAISDDFPIETTSFQKDNSGEVYVNTENRNTQHRGFVSANINFKKSIKKIRSSIFFGAQMTSFQRDLQSNIFNSYNSSPAILEQNRSQNNKVKLYTLRADLEKKVGKEWNCEFGVSLTMPDANATLSTYDFTNTISHSSEYLYRENGFSAYTACSGKVYSKIDFNAGLRVEDFSISGRFNGSAQPLVSRENIQLFPKLGVSYPLSESTTASMNYARSITRPDYSNLSQLTVYVNPYYEWSSNINILPSLTDEVNATIQLKDKSLQIGLYRVKGPIYPDFQFSQTENRLRRMDINFAEEKGCTFGATVPFKYKVWTSTNTLTAGLVKLTQPNAFLNKPTPYLYFYSNNQLKFKKDLAVALVTWGITERSEGIFRRNGQFALDTSISKTFDKRLVCTLSANNVFNSLSNEERFQINNIASVGNYFTTRDFSISVKYSLGGIANSKFKNRDIDEAPSRIN